MAATGIRRRHSSECGWRHGGRCNCFHGWEAHVFVGGQKRRRTFKSQAAAKAWRTDQETAKSAGTIAPEPSRLTVRQAAEQWLEDAKAGVVRERSGREYKPATIRGYRKSLKRDVLPKLGDYRLSELRRRQVQELVDTLLRRKLRPSTVRNTIDPLRAMYRYATERELVVVDPTDGVKVPTSTGRRERIVSPKQAAALIEALPVSEQALWATAFYAGLRCGELRALRCCDVDLAGGVIHVRRNWDEYEGPMTTKTKAGQRRVPIVGGLRDLLDEHLLREGRSGVDLVFGREADKPFIKTTVNARAERAWKDAGLERMTLHECRHTFASLMIDAGVNAKALSTYIGHSSVSFTFDRYGHLMPGGEEEAAQKLTDYLARQADPCATRAPVSSRNERFPADSPSSEPVEKATISRQNAAASR